MKELTKTSAKVLLVDDCEEDIELVQMALAKEKLLIDLSIARCGEEAMEYLENKKNTQDIYLPDLILLDINMPGMNGIEVLQLLKSDAVLKSIPVVILTSSHNDLDIAASYNGHANCYLEKPLNFHSFSKMVGLLSEFWFSLVVLPKKQ